MKERTIKIIIHVMIWGAFLVMLLIFMPFYDMKLQEMPVYFILMFAILIGYYYLNSLVLVPWLLAPGKFFLFTLLTLAILTFYLYLADSLDWMQPGRRMPYPGTPRPEPDRMPDAGFYIPPDSVLLKAEDLPGNEMPARRIKPFLSDPRLKFPVSPALTFILVFMVSTGTRVISFWFESERNKNRALREKSLAELIALKGQLNPHFLFNTLNSIYYLAIRKSDNTPDVILKLSDLMRFLLTETTAETIALGKEVECIRQYIDLQQLRLTGKTEIVFETNGAFEDQPVTPLLLLPFVENAFKFGVSSHTPSAIFISLTVLNGKLTFIVRNRKVNTIRSEESTGTGLKNVRRRLNLTYPDRHALMIRETDNDYDVELKIILA